MLLTLFEGSGILVRISGEPDCVEHSIVHMEQLIESIRR